MAHVLPLLGDPAEAVDREIDGLPFGPAAAALGHLAWADRVLILCALYGAHTLDRMSSLTLNFLSASCVAPSDPVALLHTVLRVVDPGCESANVRARVSRARHGRLEGCRFHLTVEGSRHAVSPDAVIRLRGETPEVAFAERIGVREETLRGWETGASQMRRAAFDRIAAKLRVPHIPDVSEDLLLEGARGGWSVVELVERAQAYEELRGHVPSPSAELLALAVRKSWRVAQLLEAAKQEETA